MINHYVIAFLLFHISCSLLAQDVGLNLKDEGAQSGYTLFAPLNNTTTYLINECGQLVHQWKSNYTPGNEVKLLPNGDIIRLAKLENNVINGGGGGGRIERLDWESKVIWAFEYNNDSLRLHHDFELLPNGNLLLLAWKSHVKADAITAGRNPDSLNTNALWSEQIIEVEPIGSDSAKIVWEWDSWDHMIQDIDASKDNYGVVEEHSELIDINFNVRGGIADWIHANSISYNSGLDQIIISLRSISEFWIIDHSTTTSESSSHSGGTYQKGGDLLMRWGNPMAYRRGTEVDQMLFNQHSVNWINPSHTGTTHDIILFNNGNTRDPAYSSVDRLAVSIVDGNYEMTSDMIFMPTQFTDTYMDTPKENFFSRFLSSAQLLENGNILICEGATGRLFEVANNEIVWEYVNPVNSDGIANKDFDLIEPIVGNIVFSAYRYNIDYLDTNIELTPKNPIEGPPWFIPSDCSHVTSIDESENSSPLVYPNPATNQVTINSGALISSVKLISMQGEVLIMSKPSNAKNTMLDLSEVPKGTYILCVNDKRQLIIIQ